MKHRLHIALALGCMAIGLTVCTARARDLTFFHVSDTHYGSSEPGDRALAVLVDRMNALPGTPYPTNLGGVVAEPRGVLHTGDITADGKPAQWAAFLRDYGLDGTDGHLRWPIYESFGNHDGGPGKPVRSGIRARNRSRANLDAVSSNGLHYAWTWDGIRFLHCGISIGTRTNAYDPEDSLPFLRGQLARPGGPVIVLHHYGFDQGHSLTWWKGDTLPAYREALAGHPILALLHGHAHDAMIYRWEGFDVYHPPHFRQQKPPESGAVSHGFFVFRITDSELTVAERKLDGTWGMTARKPVGSAPHRETAP